MLIIGHRGARKKYTENTLGAFKAAIDKGADMIELDVQRTKDNVLVVIHDPTVDRTTDSEGFVSKMTLKEFKETRTKEGESLPTLREVYELTKGKIQVLTEIKDVNIVEDLADLIKEMGVSDDVVVQSFLHSEIAEFIKYDKKTRTALLLDEILLAGNVINTVLDKVGAKGIVMRSKGINGDIVNVLHTNNKFVYAWGLEGDDEARRILALGVDGKIIVL